MGFVCMHTCCGLNIFLGVKIIGVLSVVFGVYYFFDSVIEIGKSASPPSTIIQVQDSPSFNQDIGQNFEFKVHVIEIPDFSDGYNVPRYEKRVDESPFDVAELLKELEGFIVPVRIRLIWSLFDIVAGSLLIRSAMVKNRKLMFPFLLSTSLRVLLHLYLSGLAVVKLTQFDDGHLLHDVVVRLLVYFLLELVIQVFFFFCVLSAFNLMDSVPQDPANPLPFHYQPRPVPTYQRGPPPTSQPGPPPIYQHGPLPIYQPAAR